MKQIDLHFNSFYLASQFKTKFSLNFNENKTNITLNLQKDEFNKKIDKIVANWYKYFPNTRMIRKGDELTILSTKKNAKFSIQFDYQKFVEPKAGESEDDFMGRCIPYVMDEGKEQDQAVAICISKWDKQYENFETYDKFYVFRLFADSSNVDAIQYDTEKEELDIRFNDGETYRYFSVDYDTFEDVWRGRSSCITSGENAYGAWFVGKRPSVGAALHKFLVKRNVRYTKL
jgi:hypothetical protein